ncbi:MAG: hypothetical protein Q7R59_01825 [bacterium]|nr:hypothetical protein [bacterium]
MSESSGLNHKEGLTTKPLEVLMPPAERRFNQETFTYILNVTQPLEATFEKASIVLPDTLEARSAAGEDITLKRKKEFHLTCVGFSHRGIMEEAAMRYADGREAFCRRVSELLSGIDFSFAVDMSTVRLIQNLEYDPEAVRERKSYESANTIIVDVETTGIQEFYRCMKEELGVDLGTSAAHATLYIQDNGDATGLGIGIKNIEEQQKGASSYGPYIASVPIQWKNEEA